MPIICPLCVPFRLTPPPSPLSGKNVQFVDMNRLPKKYRDRVVGQLKTKREQAEEERQSQREEQEEEDRLVRVAEARAQVEMRRELDLQLQRGRDGRAAAWGMGTMAAPGGACREGGGAVAGDENELLGSMPEGSSSGDALADVGGRGGAEAEEEFVVPPGWELPGSQKPGGVSLQDLEEEDEEEEDGEEEEGEDGDVSPT